MRRITCKKLGSVTALTVGTAYEIIRETEDRFIIVNDKGVESRYGKNLFEEPVQFDLDIMAPAEGVVAGAEMTPQVARRRGPGRPSRAEIAARLAVEVGGAPLAQRPLAPAAAIPPPPPAPRVVQTLEVLTGATLSGNQVKFNAAFDFGNNEIMRYETAWIIDTAGVSASCGIQSLNGLDSLRSHFEGMRSNFNQFLHANRNSFRLAEDIDVEEVFANTASAWLQDLVAAFQGEEDDDDNVKAGVLILSTTAHTIGRTPVLKAALDTIASGITEANNPNSGNDIIVWTIAAGE